MIQRSKASSGYNYGFMDEFAKKEIRRKSLKALSIPGYLVPYASREMPIGRGFGTGGLQLSLSLLGPGDVIKVIDQGSDASVNAVNLRRFITMTCPSVRTTTQTRQATLIQTRHRVPEAELKAGQIMVYQVPYPDSLVVVEASEEKRKRMHGEGDYAALLVRLYEDVVQYGEVRISHRYPTRIHGHYVIDPSPIPRYDVPRLHMSEAIHLFGAGREKKIYAVPPYTKAEPLVFDDLPFRVEDFKDEFGQRRACERCGSRESFLDEFMNDAGATLFRCSDSEYCDARVDSDSAEAKEQA